MNQDFNNLFQHDAVIKSITIDRSKPGKQDVVSIALFLPNELKGIVVEFYDCYAFICNMNFGIEAEESISFSECIYDSIELFELNAKWKKTGVNLKGMKYYRIVTNSTSSEIKIFSLGFTVKQQ